MKYASDSLPKGPCAYRGHPVEMVNRKGRAQPGSLHFRFYGKLKV